MTNKQQARADRVRRNTKLIEGRGFDLRYFSKIHVRINDRVDFWLSTGTWHIKNQKSESKCYDEMIKYLETGKMAKMNMTLKIDSSELQEMLSEFKEMLDRREAKIKELESRIEAIERCPAVVTDLP